jgi:hypothetical protein
MFGRHFMPAPRGRCGICGHGDPVAAYPVVRRGGGRAAQARGHHDVAAELGVSRRHVPSDQIALHLDTSRAQQRCQHDDRSQRPCHPDPPIGTHPNPRRACRLSTSPQRRQGLMQAGCRRCEDRMEINPHTKRTPAALARSACPPATSPARAQSPPRRHAATHTALVGRSPGLAAGLVLLAKIRRSLFAR